MLQLVLMAAWLILVVVLFRANLQVARLSLQPMKRDRDRAMAADEQARDEVLRGIALAANAVVQEMNRTFGMGKFAFLTCGTFFWSSYTEWQTYMLLVPAAGQGLLHWATGNHLRIVSLRLEQLSLDDRAEVDRLRKLG